MRQTYLLVVLFVLLTPFGLTKADDSTLPIYVEPPAPEELAQVLYGPRYRSNDSTNAEQGFGMMINFEYDSTIVLPESLPMLDSVGKMLDLAAARKEVLVIEGHTDATGGERYNHDLSIRRARAIKEYLVDAYQVDGARLVTIGQGEGELHKPDEPEHALNRRVEFRSLDSVVVQ